MTKILYLGSPADFDRYTAQVILRWFHANTGNRGLVVVYPRSRA